MAEYSVAVRNQSGTLLDVITQYASLEYSRRVGQRGALILTLDGTAYTPDDFGYDYRLEVWRAVRGVSGLEMQTCWFPRRFAQILDQDGNEYLEVTAYDTLDLLRRRSTAAYYAGTSYTDKTDYLDDMMKDVVRQNFGPDATDTAREIDTYLSVAADVAGAGSKSMAFSYRTVLDILNDMAAVSMTAGAYLAFDIEYWPTAAAPFIFKTYTTARGSDARWPSSASPLLISPETGNLGDVTLTVDRSDEVNFIYAAGQGEGSQRATTTAGNTAAMTVSPFNRCEGFVDARHVTTAAALQSEADAALDERRARTRFTGRLPETAGTRYGIEYGYGSFVTAQFKGATYDCHLDYLHVDVRGGDEVIDARLEYEE